MAGFSWRRGLLSAVLPVAVILAVFAWITRLHPSVRTWWLLAVFMVFEVVLALASSYLSQTGRKELARLVSVGASIALVGGVWWYVQRPAGSATFTAEERVPFVTVDRNGERRLLHPALGFSVLDPGAGFVASGSQAFRSNAQFYVFTDRDAGESLSIGLFKGMGDSPGSLRGLIESMGREAATLAGRSGAPVEVVGLDVPEADPPRGELHAVIGRNRHYRLRAYGWKRPDQAPIAVLIAILSSSADAHTDVLASFQP
jgi:hypothetical protein